MKVCLVNPKSLIPVELGIPHGLLQLTAELKKMKHECTIVDFNNGAITYNYDKLKRFDIVGLSVMTTQLKHASEIADYLGDAVKVVWGGAHCLFDPLSILNRYKSHYVVSGDGERPLVKLLDYLEGRVDLETLSRQGGGILLR